MDAVRVPRFGLTALFEWIVAAAFLAATVAVGSLILNGLRATPRVDVAAAPARPLVTSTPAAVPARAASPPTVPAVCRRRNRPRR